MLWENYFSWNGSWGQSRNLDLPFLEMPNGNWVLIERRGRNVICFCIHHLKGSGTTNRLTYRLIRYKSDYTYQVLRPFLAIFCEICMVIFHKTEIQTVILRCLTGQNLEFWKYDSWFPSEDSKLTSVGNKLKLLLKYWFFEAKVGIWICYGPKKWSKYLVDTIQTTFCK